MTRRLSSSSNCKSNRHYRSRFLTRGTRAATRDQLKYEAFEARVMLSVSTGSSPVDQQLILHHISSTPETAYLQQNESNLQLIAVENDGAKTTSLFQQTVNEIPIHNAYITVVQNSDGEFDGVYDRGFEHFVSHRGDQPVIGSGLAEQITNEEFIDRTELTSTSELVWYPSENSARLTWQVSTFFGTSSEDNSNADYITIVDAHSGTILEQDTPGTVIEDLLETPETLTGVYPRIVINNAIGAQGSRDYAASFDAVVDIFGGGCTGTLIASNTVLSARHCGAGAGDQIFFGDDSNNSIYTATVQSAFLPGGGNANSDLLNGGDVSILTLTSNVPANIATPMRLISQGSSLVGQIAATIGYGLNGLGSQGHQNSADGWRWGGENIIDAYGSPAGASGSNVFSTDFDNGSSSNNTIGGSSPTPLTFEATTAPGDSGGPILVEVGNEWVIAGVLSGGTTNTSVYGDISWWTGVAPYQSAIEARGGVFIGSEPGLGTVAFDANSYGVGDTITVTVNDPNAVTPINVTIVSDSGDSETLTLSGSGSNFSGNLAISDTGVSTNDGTLQVSVLDLITVTYVDPDNGTGGSTTVTDTATIFDINSSSVLIGIDFDLSGGSNPTNWLEISDGTDQTFSNLSDENGNGTGIDLTIEETAQGEWFSYEASPNANTLPQHMTSLANLDGQIYSDADPFRLTYSDLNPLTDYEIYLYSLDTFFASIEQRVTITGAGTPVIFDQEFTSGQLFINDQVGDSNRSLGEYAQVVTANSNGQIVIKVDPISGTDDVVLAGIAISEVETDGGTPSINLLGPSQINEGDSGTSQAQFQVTLSQPATEVVEVDYATTSSGFSNPATPDVDFQDVMGTLVFQPGETSKSVFVDVYGDRFNEVHEEFGLELSDSVGGNISIGDASVVITDNDDFALGVAIDFGTETSPVDSSSIGFLADDYSAALGMGWQNTNALNMVERRRGSDLTRDFAVMRNAELVVDIANGDYEVTAIFGFSRRLDAFQIIVEGSSQTLTLNHGLNVTRTFVTTVSDGQLNFELDGSPGLDVRTRIAGLLIEAIPGRPSKLDSGETLVQSSDDLGRNSLTWLGGVVPNEVSPVKIYEASTAARVDDYSRGIGPAVIASPIKSIPSYEWKATEPNRDSLPARKVVKTGLDESLKVDFMNLLVDELFV